VELGPFLFEALRILGLDSRLVRGTFCHHLVVQALGPLLFFDLGLTLQSGLVLDRFLLEPVEFLLIAGVRELPWVHG
jgi:hypothetical protein